METCKSHDEMPPGVDGCRVVDGLRHVPTPARAQGYAPPPDEPSADASLADVLDENCRVVNWGSSTGGTADAVGHRSRGPVRRATNVDQLNLRVLEPIREDEEWTPDGLGTTVDFPCFEEWLAENLDLSSEPPATAGHIQ